MFVRKENIAGGFAVQSYVVRSHGSILWKDVAQTRVAGEKLMEDPSAKY